MTEKTIKAAPPESLFSRFLQRKTKRPTPKQIHTWENDGGNVKNADDDFVVINGVVCYTAWQKLKAYSTKYWRLFKLQFQPKQTQQNQF